MMTELDFPHECSECGWSGKHSEMIYEDRTPTDPMEAKKVLYCPKCRSRQAIMLQPNKPDKHGWRPIEAWARS